MLNWWMVYNSFTFGMPEVAKRILLTKTCEKISKSCPKIIRNLKKAYKVHVSLDKSTHTCDAYEAFKEKESMLRLENETIAKEKYTLLENFQELEDKLKGLQKDLKELNELHNHQSEDRYGMFTSTQRL
ncbi:hypothetical protein JHK86_043177 [Glycine max]|nr:hypothetical protein JHK86_043177 [Glycine max]